MKGMTQIVEILSALFCNYNGANNYKVWYYENKQIRIFKRSVMTMIFDFEPWQLDIDIDLTKQLYRSCKGDFVWVEKK